MATRTITAEIDGKVRKITADIPDGATPGDIENAVREYMSQTPQSEANKALAGTGLSVPDVPNPPRPYALASPQEQASRYADPMSAPKGDIIPYEGMGSAGTSDILEGAGRIANNDQPTLDRVGGAVQTTGGVLSSLAGIGMPAGARPNRGFESTTARLKAGLTNTGTTPTELAEMALSPKTAILKKVLRMATKAPEKGAPVSLSIPAYVNKSPIPPSSVTTVPPLRSGVSGQASDISQGPYTPLSGMPQLPIRGGNPTSGPPLPQMPTGIAGGASQVTTPEIPPYLPRPMPGIPTPTRAAPMPINRPMTRTGIPESANPKAISSPTSIPTSRPDNLSYHIPSPNTVLNTGAKDVAEALKNELGGTPGKPMVIPGSDTRAAGEAAHEANSWLKELRGQSKVSSNADLAGAMKNKAPGDVSSVRDSIIKAMSPEASTIVLRELGIGDIPQMARGGVVLPTDHKTVLSTVKAPEEVASGQDIIRGSSDIPLSDKGLQQSTELAKQFKAKGGVDRIDTSNLKRARQTAEDIGKQIGQTPKPTADLRPWHLGEIEGQPTHTVLDRMKRYIIKQPNVKVPGQGPQSTSPGEAFNTFKRRALTGLKTSLQELKANPNGKVVKVTHYRVVRLTEAWAARGFPDSMEIDPKIMESKGSDPPGTVLRLWWRGTKPALDKVNMKEGGKLPGGIYLTRHGLTKHNEENFS